MVKLAESRLMLRSNEICHVFHGMAGMSESDFKISCFKISGMEP
jgi:hypothetical protein